MNSLARFLFVLKEGFRQLLGTRGLSTAVMVIVAATLLQLSFFLGISRILDRALASAREKFEMVVFLAPSAGDADVKRIQALLDGDPRVASARLVTKEQALQDFRKDPEIDQMVKALGENPLTDSFTVVLKKDAPGNLEDLAARLRKDPQVSEVDYGKHEWETVAELTRVVRWVGWLVGGLVFLTALFIVSNTLTLALWARREDMILLSRMGAPGWMRWGPYLWEGLLQGLLGGVLAVAFLEAVRYGAGLALRKAGSFDFLSSLPSAQWRSLYATLVLLGVILGLFGAFLALRKKWVRELS